jgi:CCR4-NOT transcriptional regulation complex NOT5 subunit
MGFFSSVKKAFKKAAPTIASGGLNLMAKSGASALPYMGFAGGAGGGPSSALSLDTNWADIAGTALSGGASAYGQYSANKQNAQLAQNQMDFQERMSSTAHQREVRDLRLAGLNPILSGTGGMGASSGPGATASMDNVAGAGVASALEALTKITQSYLIREQTDRAKAETENIKTTNPQIRAQTKKTEQETNSSKALEKNLEMDTVLKLSQRLKNLSEVNKNDELTKLLTKQGVSQEMQARLMSLQGDQALEMLKGMKLEGQIDETTYGDIMRHVKRFFDALPFSGSTSKRF